ncbi:4Fe-4S dicluster domain-containing protein [Desulfovibrio inopinatus]|uniref:4Fe-4S dicluster domain-containing protein n=1 Tax=Desulfovibrio inopinatus TaxID=102109 RepID=UPI0004203ACB|nr:hypothetical protein [Desulfovibrio inopinatus]
MLQIEDTIKTFLSTPENNSLSPHWGFRAFDQPLVGYADGDDPLFTAIKNDIGTFYQTPREAFRQAFPGTSPKHIGVIAWILPHTERTRRAHRSMTDMPSLNWSLARLFGENVNENLRRHVVTALTASGLRALAPTLAPEWTRAQSPRYGFASTWSERHTAFVCGLGTFGLSDGLITAKGKAIRVGSVIADCTVTPTPRPYTHHQEYCLRTHGVDCKACIKRCPAHAITPSGHDKEQCKTYIRGSTRPYVEEQQLGVPVNSCGLCQTGIPCEAGIPKLVQRRLKLSRNQTASCPQ